LIPPALFEFRPLQGIFQRISDQWMSHGIDLCHYFMDEKLSAVGRDNGGIFAWHDGRENPDTFMPVFTYPKGFLVSYATSFAMMRPVSPHHGKKATMINRRRRRQPALANGWKRRENTMKMTPKVDKQRASKTSCYSR